MSMHIYTIVFIAVLSVSAPFGQRSAMADETSIQATISGQLDAFARGDFNKAYSYAAPFIQQRFSSPQIFMQMVTTGYGALISPLGYQFSDLEITDTRALQRLALQAADGSSWDVIYQMTLVPDGQWLIAGVFLEKRPDGTV